MCGRYCFYGRFSTFYTTMFSEGLQKEKKQKNAFNTHKIRVYVLDLFDFRLLATVLIFYWIRFRFGGMTEHMKVKI